MTYFEARFVQDTPKQYYIVTGESAVEGDWLNINPIVTSRPILAPGRNVRIFSEEGKKKADQLGVPLKLICLSCFAHIIRVGNLIRYATLDDLYPVRILPWRAPCETTIVYEEGNDQYYIEGCRDSGVFWRTISQAPRTEPPFVSCGSLDLNGGCWYQDCPHGAFFDDDTEPFATHHD